MWGWHVIPGPTVTSVECLLMTLILSANPFLATIVTAASAMGLKTYRWKNKYTRVKPQLSLVPICCCYFAWLQHLCIKGQAGDIKFTSNLHCIAVIRSSSDSHHGQQTSSCPNVEDNNLLATGLHPLNSSLDTLVVLHVLTDTDNKGGWDIYDLFDGNNAIPNMRGLRMRILF